MNAHQPYRALDPKAFAGEGLTFAATIGDEPVLEFLSIDKLVIDPTYQREILKNGRKNVRRIAAEFRWSHFEPVVVAPTGDGRFAIINGQHRATGAALRGIKKVPCAIVKADRSEQAAAFTAINGNVTAVTPMQLYHAALSANDPSAAALEKVCRAAGVNVCRYPIPAGKMKPGDTLAAGKLRQAYARYGGPTLQAALECITKTGGGNPGLIRSHIVQALCAVLADAPKWRDHKKRNASIEALSLRELWDEARKIAAEGTHSINDLLTRALRTHFKNELGEAG